MDVLPDVQLGPVGEGEDADRLAAVDPAVVEVPELRPLVLRVPAVVPVAEGVDALLGARLLLVAAGPAERGVELVLREGLEQALGLHDVGVLLAPVGDGPDSPADAVLINIDQELPAELLPDVVLPEFDHLPEFPGGVHVQEREGGLGRVERLLGQPDHDGGILADRVEHDRLLELRDDLAEDVNALGFELLEVGEGLRFHEGNLR